MEDKKQIYAYCHKIYELYQIDFAIEYKKDPFIQFGETHKECCSANVQDYEVIVYQKEKQGKLLLKVLCLYLEDVFIHRKVQFKHILDGSDDLIFNTESKVLYVISQLVDVDLAYEAFSNVLEKQDYIFKYQKQLIIIKTEQDYSFTRIVEDVCLRELMMKVRVGCSKPFVEKEEVVEAYHQAMKALSVHALFHINQTTHIYDEQNLLYVLAHVPLHKAQGYLDLFPAFKQLSYEDFITIQTVIDCNLNVAQAARKMYVHRNTLLYRIDKIQKELGLDLLNFHDALKLKVLILLNEMTKN